MQRRKLGNSGLMVSPLGLGTWTMGGAAESWGPVDDRESIATIHQALDCGINLIDTAPIYGLGHSEEVVGKAIQGRRHEVILATKCGLLFPKSKDQVPVRCLSKASVLRECEQSLRRLRVDVIDIYHCHWPDPETPISETMAALGTLLERGLVRAVGLSNFGCGELADARRCGAVHCLQPLFSMLARDAADDLIPYALEHGIAVLPYSPLAKGLLAGRFDIESRFTGIRSRDPEFIGERYRRNLRLVDQLREIAARYDRTLVQLVINWTASFPGVTSAIVGARRPSQIHENAGGAGWDLRNDDRILIDRLLKE